MREGPYSESYDRRDDWFRWFHNATDELGFKISLKDLSNLMGLSHSRVRHLHAEYQAEYN